MRFLMAVLAALLLFPASLQANPAIAGDYPDPSVIRDGDDFWAVATSSEWGPHFPILHSKNRGPWELKGYVFPQKPAPSAATK